MTVRIAGAVLAAAFVWLSGSGEARAVGLCNCCATSLTESCEAVCRNVTLEPQQCPAVVDYVGTGDTVKGTNPLNGRSLKDIVMGEPKRKQLEKFRLFLEDNRQDAVWVYVKALKAFKRKKITREELDAAKALNEEALVNYYHGMNGYLEKFDTNSD